MLPKNWVETDLDTVVLRMTNGSSLKQEEEPFEGSLPISRIVVRIGATDHPMDRASMHHFLYRSPDYWDDVEIDQDWFEKRASRRVTIGHDTWIGHNAQIKPEITIGHGAIVASGAVVTKDVAPFTIVAGVPATPMRERFDRKISERLGLVAKVVTQCK